jgi:phosphoribosylanthranilate isomerase
VKICGITRPEDARAAAMAGADAIGLVFYAPSPRHVTYQQANEIIRALPPFVTTVGLFVNAEKSYIQEVMDNVAIDLLQFHGQESAPECGRYQRPYIKAIAMREGEDPAIMAAGFPDAQGILLDSYHATQVGGTGESFDWTRVPRNLNLPIILAGGLYPDNVAEAVRQVRPYAVDVSSGVEAQKGIKDADKIAAFIAAAKHE